ncbi:MAG TPA: thioredoxin domain-containing protein [Pyrinomonadaceae bacterium]|jgi:protein-disulfide isomerase
MNNNKNRNFLFVLTGLFLLVAIIGSGCGGGNNSSGGNSTRNGSNANRANNASTAPNYATAPAGASPAHFKGGQSAKVVIEEFADYQCPTCAQIHPTVQQIQAAYGDRVKIIFRNYPLTQIHPKAYDAATAAEAAGLQGKFWEMQNQLFTNQQFWSTTSADHRKMFEEYAQKIGLDIQKFNADMGGIEAKSRVDADLQRARGLSVGSTPTFYVNGRQLPYEDTEFNRFRQAIDAELQRTQSTTQSAPDTSNAATPAAANTVGVNTSAGSNANRAGANK